MALTEPALIPRLIPRESQTHNLNLFTLKLNQLQIRKKVKLKTLNIKLTFD